MAVALALRITQPAALTNASANMRIYSGTTYANSVCCPCEQKSSSESDSDSETPFVDSKEFMDGILDSVVRIYCTHNLPSYSLPWQRLRQDQSTSTGFVIEGRRIITNAHSVEYSTMIQVSYVSLYAISPCNTITTSRSFAHS
jgi:V8-like Glu-specific endopeptidase